jgi:pyridoxamine 5'-phosphate oxidase family protein
MVVNALTNLWEGNLMSKFSTEELDYLTGDGHLGRLATIDEHGVPHVVPLGWGYNPELDTVEIGGRNAVEFTASRKVRNVRANPHVAFVVDDVLPPFQPRAVMVRGTGEIIQSTAEDGSVTAQIRITPTEIISWGLNTSGQAPGT